jgi:hypothetical protein
LPDACLTFTPIAYIARQTRSSMLEVLHSNFIRTARAKGLPGYQVVFKHALKPALLPVISYLGPVFVGMITVAVLKVAHIPEHLGSFISPDAPITPRELSDLAFASSILVGVAVCTAWYFLTSAWDKSASPANRQAAADFFDNLHTPVNAVKEGITDNDERQFRILGIMSLIYAAFILLCTAIPNNLLGRLCFVFCGLVFLAVGSGLYLAAIRHRKLAAARSDADKALQPAVTSSRSSNNCE